MINLDLKFSIVDEFGMTRMETVRKSANTFTNGKYKNYRLEKDRGDISGSETLLGIYWELKDATKNGYWTLDKSRKLLKCKK